MYTPSNAYSHSKLISKSELYKNVYKRQRMDNGAIYFEGRVLQISKSFDNERDAALFVDKVLVNHFREPRNILKRKI